MFIKTIITKTLGNIIESYLSVVYKVELLGEENEHIYFSADECMFGHELREQVSVMAITNNTTY